MFLLYINCITCIYIKYFRMPAIYRSCDSVGWRCQRSCLCTGRSLATLAKVSICETELQCDNTKSISVIQSVIVILSKTTELRHVVANIYNVK